MSNRFETLQAEDPQTRRSRQSRLGPCPHGNDPVHPFGRFDSRWVAGCQPRSRRGGRGRGRRNRGPVARIWLRGSRALLPWIDDVRCDGIGPTSSLRGFLILATCRSGRPV